MKEVRHRKMLSLKKDVKQVTIKNQIKIPLLNVKKMYMFCSPVKQKGKSLISHSRIPKHMSLSEKVSLCGSQGLKAGMTVEAAVVLPFFLLIILSVFSFLELTRFQCGITMGLREAGKSISVYGYAYDRMEENADLDLTGLVPSVALSYVYAGAEVEKFLGEEYMEDSPLPVGKSSIQYYHSSIMEEEDIVDLVAFYQGELSFNIAMLPKIHMESRYYGRAWTGYELEGKSAEPQQELNVYITPGGTAYHMNRYCSHLQLTIRACSKEQLVNQENENGEKYRACSICVLGTMGNKVFITSQGNCYHYSINCSGLKRTIEVIPISKVGNRTRCSRCGG